MICLLLLLGYDSLPPLPDLSKISLPEPVLWIQPVERGLLFNAFTGQFYGADLDLNLDKVHARGQFIRHNEWDSTDMGSAQVTATMTLPRLWLKPSLSARLLQRRDDYTEITPGLGFVVFTSPVVATGAFDYSHWRINNETASEATGEISFVFDQITYFPSMMVRGIYTAKQLKPSLFAQLHISGFQLELGSLVRTGFPSPILKITYRDPWIEAAAGVQTGVKHNTLGEYFRPELPTSYRIDIPAETIRVAVDLGITLNVHNQRFAAGGTYKKWQYRLNIGEDYVISSIRDIRETNIEVSAKNNLSIGSIDLRNALQVQYNVCDSAITFLPEITIIDTFQVAIGGLEISADLRYLSQRTGTGKSLPRSYVVSTKAGLRIYFLKFYFLIHNITDEQCEIYDDYFFTGKQYAGGLEIKHPF